MRTRRCSTPWVESEDSGRRVAFQGDLGAEGVVDGVAYGKYLHVTWDGDEGHGLYHRRELVLLDPERVAT